MDHILGIDIGATGTKGALVDTKTGEFVTERVKFPTPKPSTPKAVIETAYKIVEELDWQGKPVGIGFPTIIKNGVSHSASNIDNAWLEFDGLSAFKKKFGTDEIVLLNDADAAGVAEMTMGYGVDVSGVVILITIGTGIGTAIFNNGALLPNSELGHLLYKKGVFEDYMANSIRERHDMSWKEWGNEVNVFLKHIEFLFSPDLILLGGGVSKKFAKYEKYITTKVTVRPAKLQNNAGITGVAMEANRLFG